uniref:NADH dehydrogenase subunit 6 n=1 Tax=Lissachatina fulica TaxID=2315439 RepID=A0A097J9J1_LISFU|nr:NADH dehydrogenase subunit 6 [Lissachatina fulica]
MMFSWMMGLSLWVSMSMWLVDSPLVIMISLVILSILMSVISGCAFSYWFGLILFLVYVGGLLVLFMYITMISSNYKLTYGLNSFACVLFIGLAVCVLSFWLLTGGPSHQLFIWSPISTSGFSVSNLVISVLVIMLLVSMLCIMSILMSLGKSTLNSKI